HLLQHVIVEQPEHAVAGFQVVREADAGRCGFLIASNPESLIPNPESPIPGDGLVALSSIVRVNGPFAGAIRHALGDAWIAQTYARAAESSALTKLPVTTVDGDVFRGPQLVS